MIVDAGYRDGVNALLFDRIGVLHETRQMALVAGAGKCPGHAEQHNLLAFENIVAGLPRRTLRRRHAKTGTWNVVADFDRHLGHPLSLSQAAESAGFECRKNHRRRSRTSLARLEI